MKYCDEFFYNGSSSGNYSLSMVSFDDDEYSFALERAIEKGDITKYRPSPNHFGTKYADVLSFQLSFVKKDAVTAGGDVYFTTDEYRSIVAWLTSPKLPQELKIREIYYTSEPNPLKDSGSGDVLDSGSHNVYSSHNLQVPHDKLTYYYGLFSNVEPIVVRDKLCGIVTTFTCSSQYGFTEEYEYTCTGGNRITIDNTSDEYNDSVYPLITIQPTATGDVTIKNVTMNRLMKINCKNTNTVTIDCRNLIIKDLAGIIKYSDLGWSTSNISDVWFPELQHGENVFQITGNATVKFKCQFPMKVGDIG